MMRYRLLGAMGARTGPRRASHRPPPRRPGRNFPDAPRARRGREGTRRNAPRCSRPPGAASRCVRPLLGWRHSELEAVLRRCRREPVAGPEQRGRAVRARARPKGARRSGLARSRRRSRKAPRISPRPTARCTGRPTGMAARGHARGGQIVYKPTDAPREIRRRIIRRAILALATEGGGAEPRGRELDQILAALRTGKGDASRRPVHRRSRMALHRAPARRAANASAEVSADRRAELGPRALGLLLVVGLAPGDGPAVVGRRDLDLRRPLRPAKAASRSGFSFGIFSASFLAMMHQIGRPALRDEQVRARRLVGHECPGWKVATAPIRSGRAAAVRNEIGPLMQ